MHCVQRDEYNKGIEIHNKILPYFTTGIELLHGRKPMQAHNSFYVEVDKGKPEKRYMYRTFKEQNRYLFRTEPR